MSMSTHVIGFRAPDEEWQKMKAVWDACAAAHVIIPDQVNAFFCGESPDPAGVEVELPARKWLTDAAEGYEIDMAEIPAHITTIRFYNGW